MYSTSIVSNPQKRILDAQILRIIKEIGAELAQLVRWMALNQVVPGSNLSKIF